MRRICQTDCTRHILFRTRLWAFSHKPLIFFLSFKIIFYNLVNILGIKKRTFSEYEIYLLVEPRRDLGRARVDVERTRLPIWNFSIWRIDSTRYEVLVFCVWAEDCSERSRRPTKFWNLIEINPWSISFSHYKNEN